MISEQAFVEQIKVYEEPNGTGDSISISGSLVRGAPSESFVRVGTDSIPAYLELPQLQELITELMERAVFLANFIEENTSKF